MATSIARPRLSPRQRREAKSALHVTEIRSYGQAHLPTIDGVEVDLEIVVTRGTGGAHILVDGARVLYPTRIVKVDGTLIAFDDGLIRGWA